MDNLVQKKFNLFHPGVLAAQSRPFEVPMNGQVTVMAIGLQGNDYIEFEMISVPGVDIQCNCLPGSGEALSVTNTQTLKFAGTPVRVTAGNPVVIITAPQGVLMRAVRHVEEELNATSLYVYGMTSLSYPVSSPYSGMDYTENQTVDDFTTLDDATPPVPSFFRDNPRG